mmetsp:Transcript_17875/g.45457  ORF Transcript_17875/g.45457 Transcript_17875/m.45457 type:complete len:178 (+) Transcript_17875:755-1288(+)
MYVFGGRDDATYLSSLQSFGFQTGRWHTHQPPGVLPGARAEMQAVATNNAVYMYGGHAETATGSRYWRTGCACALPRSAAVRVRGRSCAPSGRARVPARRLCRTPPPSRLCWRAGTTPCSSAFSGMCSAWCGKCRQACAHDDPLDRASTAGCLRMAFCSRECQAAAWKEHKLTCAPP